MTRLGMLLQQRLPPRPCHYWPAARRHHQRQARYRVSKDFAIDICIAIFRYLHFRRFVALRPPI